MAFIFCAPLSPLLEHNQIILRVSIPREHLEEIPIYHMVEYEGKECFWLTLPRYSRFLFV